jgi:hypothetical protein
MRNTKKVLGKVEISTSPIGDTSEVLDLLTPARRKAVAYDIAKKQEEPPALKSSFDGFKSEAAKKKWIASVSQTDLSPRELASVRVNDSVVFDASNRRNSLAITLAGRTSVLEKIYAACGSNLPVCVCDSLVRKEACIAHGLQGAFAAASAIREIRDTKLYLIEFDTFEAYLEATWNYSRSYGYKLIKFAEAVEAGEVSADDSVNSVSGSKKAKTKADGDGSSSSRDGVPVVDVVIEKLDDIRKKIFSSLTWDEFLQVREFVALLLEDINVAAKRDKGNVRPGS